MFGRYSLIHDWEGVENWDQEGAIGKKAVQNNNLSQGSLPSPLSFFMFVSLTRLSVHQISRSPENEEKECLIAS